MSQDGPCLRGETKRKSEKNQPKGSRTCEGDEFPNRRGGSKYSKRRRENVHCEKNSRIAEKSRGRLRWQTGEKRLSGNPGEGGKASNPQTLGEVKADKFKDSCRAVKEQRMEHFREKVLSTEIRYLKHKDSSREEDSSEMKKNHE